MVDTMICPRCGTRNRAEAVNCRACRINLKFAQENPTDFVRVMPEDASQKQREGGTLVLDRVPITGSREGLELLPVLLLFGSFVFAFCFGEAVHELGHFLAQRAYGLPAEVRLDPFGGSMVSHEASAPVAIRGITSAMGPLLNLVASMTVTLALWRNRKPALLAFLLWGPVALIQESASLSLGIFTQSGDAALIAGAGFPTVILLDLGVFFFLSGVLMFALLLPQVNLLPGDPFQKKFSVLSTGMVSFIGFRFLYSILFSGNLAEENAVWLIFTLVLATMVGALHRPLYPLLSQIAEMKPASITKAEAGLSMALGLGMVLFQVVIFN